MKISKERIAEEVRFHKVAAYSQGGNSVIPILWWLKRPSGGVRLYHNYSVFLKGQSNFGVIAEVEGKPEEDFDIRKELK